MISFKHPHGAKEIHILVPNQKKTEGNSDDTSIVKICNVQEIRHVDTACEQSSRIWLLQDPAHDVCHVLQSL